MARKAVTRICLVGATGMVGAAIVRGAVARADVRVIAVSRREVPIPPGARMEVLLAPVSGWSDAIAASGADVLVCALGTTMKQAGGDREAFRSVDHDLVLTVGQAARDAGIERMIVVSSVGADDGSSNFYLGTKGRMETDLRKLRFRRLDILRPGLLVGKRAQFRLAERIAMIFHPVLNLFLHGNRRKFRSISADTVAQAIFALVHQRSGGRFVHEFDAMNYAIKRSVDFSGMAGAD